MVNENTDNEIMELIPRGASEKAKVAVVKAAKAYVVDKFKNYLKGVNTDDDAFKAMAVALRSEGYSELGACFVALAIENAR